MTNSIIGCIPNSSNSSSNSISSISVGCRGLPAAGAGRGADQVRGPRGRRRQDYDIIPYMI